MIWCSSRTLRIGGKLHLRGHVQDIPREMAYCFIATNFTHGIKKTKWDSSRSTTREKFNSFTWFNSSDGLSQKGNGIVRRRLAQVFITMLWIYVRVGVARSWVQEKILSPTLFVLHLQKLILSFYKAASLPFFIRSNINHESMSTNTSNNPPRSSATNDEDGHEGDDKEEDCDEFDADKMPPLFSRWR